MDFKIISMVLMAMLFLSCASPKISSLKKVNQKMSPDIIYKKDMIIHVNGQTGVGALVVKKADVYNFHIEASGTLDLFTFKTCHREWDKQRAWNVETIKKRLFWKKKIQHKKQIKFSITPTEIEKSRFCLAELNGYERKQGRHSQGIVDYESERETLPATLHCNGATMHSNGVSICQSKEGLFQMIEFEIETVVIGSKECAKMEISDNKKFTWTTSKGECVYAFVGNGSDKTHRLTTFGHEAIRIIGND